MSCVFCEIGFLGANALLLYMLSSPPSSSIRMSTFVGPSAPSIVVQRILHKHRLYEMHHCSSNVKVPNYVRRTSLVYTK